MKLTKLMLLCFITGAIFSCKKSGDQISINGQLSGKEPGFLVKNDFTLNSRTITEDSLRTDSLRTYYFGAINDPLFGTTQASVYSQLSLDQIGQVLTVSNTLDSVVLTIMLADSGYFYGNFNSTLDIDVFEVTEELGEDVRHYSKDVIAYNPIAIGTYSGVPNFNDSITVRNLDATKRIGPAIRIKMTNDFASKLFNASSSDLSSIDNFRNFINGLAIVPRTSSLAPNEGGVFGVNMDNIQSQLTLYYDDTKQSVFGISNNDAEIFTTFVSGNVPADIQTQISTDGDYVKGFVRGTGDTKVHITFPDLFDILDQGSININKATLKVKVLDGTSSPTFPVINTLYIAQPNPDNDMNALILDYSLYLGKQSGEYSATDNSYSFIITRHLQDILLSKKNLNVDDNRGLYLLNFANAFRSSGGGVLDPLKQGRVVLDTRTGTGIQLEILYSKID